MSKLLDFMVNINNASEDDANNILRLADRESYNDRPEMEDHFKECLGYNPMTHFDRLSLMDFYDSIANAAPFSVKEKLYSLKEEIVDRALECLTDVNDALLNKILIELVSESVGWTYEPEDYVSVDDCVKMSIFGDLSFEDEDAEDLEGELPPGLDDDDEDDTDEEVTTDDDDF